MGRVISNMAVFGESDRTECKYASRHPACFVTVVDKACHLPHSYRLSFLQEVDMDPLDRLV